MQHYLALEGVNVGARNNGASTESSERLLSVTVGTICVLECVNSDVDPPWYLFPEGGDPMSEGGRASLSSFQSICKFTSVHEQAVPGQPLSTILGFRLTFGILGYTLDCQMSLDCQLLGKRRLGYPRGGVGINVRPPVI